MRDGRGWAVAVACLAASGCLNVIGGVDVPSTENGGAGDGTTGDSGTMQLDSSATRAEADSSDGGCIGAGCPVTLVSGAGGAFTAIATDGTSVYWSDGSSVWSCAVGGCQNNPSVVVQGQTVNGMGIVGGLAVDDTSVYWLGDSGVLKCPKAGCGSNMPTLVVAQAQNFITGQLTHIAVDSSSVYWVSTVDVAVYQGASAGGTATMLAPGEALSLTIDATSVYWTNLRGSSNTVLACGKSGCGMAPTVLATGYANGDGSLVNSIAVDGSGVYWNDGYGWGGVETCPRSEFAAPGACGGGSALPTINGTATELTPANAPNAMASDGTNVFWTYYNGFTKGSDGIATCSANGSCGILVEHGGSPQYIAVDAMNVYWTDAQTPTIMKVPKSG